MEASKTESVPLQVKLLSLARFDGKRCLLDHYRVVTAINSSATNAAAVADCYVGIVNE